MGGIGKSSRSARAKRVGVADALFTKGQQRVLGVLFGNSGRSFYANEIISLAGSGTGAVQRELARLESAGLVTVKRIGNQKHYQANAAASVFSELRGLVLKTSGLVDVLRVGLAPLTSRIRAAFVFGSIAKGEDAATSDVDLMVISDDVTYADLFDALEDVSSKLGRRVNPTIYAPAEIADKVEQENAFLKRVTSQPKIWLIGGERDLAA
jgi:predicted nucleotidyltransferase